MIKNSEYTIYYFPSPYLTNYKQAIQPKALSLHQTRLKYMIKAALNAQLNKDFEKILIARINKLAEDKKPIAKVAESHYRVYLQATSLNGFNYLEFTFISPIAIKTMAGCTLTFKSDAGDFVLKSESDIIESDYANSSKIGITIVDADLEDDFNTFIKSNKISEITLNCKIGTVFKKKVSVSYPEIDMQAFAASMVPKEAEVGEISSPGGGSSLGI